MTRRAPLLRWLCIAALLIAALPAAPSLAAPPRQSQTKETALQRIQRSVARINEEAKTPAGESAVLKRLSAQLRVSEDQLRAERDAWGVGYGEVAMAHAFAAASRTGKKPSDVVGMRHAGMEWSAIAKELKVKVDAVATRMKRHARAAPAR